jgi:hypothetical protein
LGGTREKEQKSKAEKHSAVYSCADRHGHGHIDRSVAGKGAASVAGGPDALQTKTPIKHLVSRKKSILLAFLQTLNDGDNPEQ